MAFDSVSLDLGTFEAGVVAFEVAFETASAVAFVQASGKDDPLVGIPSSYLPNKIKEA